MTPNNFESPRRPVGSGRANAVRQARMARVRMIRRRVVGGATALFVSAWLLIAVVLVSGHDPALARKAASTSVATGTSSASTTTNPTTTTSGTTSSGTTSSGTTSSGSTSSASTGSQTGGTTSSVTTKQS